MGHLEGRRTVELNKERFYWPKMTEDVNHFVTKLRTCVKSKKPSITYEDLMKSIISLSPLQLVDIDFLHLDPWSGRNEYLLVITNHFTKAHPSISNNKQEYKNSSWEVIQRFHDGLFYDRYLWEITEKQRDRIWKWAVPVTIKTLWHKKNTYYAIPFTNQ